MRISFKRFDAYPGADIVITIFEVWRRPRQKAFIKLEASGNCKSREALAGDLSVWTEQRQIRLKVSTDPILDHYQGYLRDWVQVAEFLVYWVGEANFSAMLREASGTTFLQEEKLRGIQEELAELRAGLLAQEQRFAAAAKAILALP